MDEPSERDPTMEQPPPPASPLSPPGPIATPSRRLRRSPTPSLGGVAGGMAAYMKLEPKVVRIAFVVLTLFFAGAGAVLYLAGWLLIPPADDPDPRPLTVTSDSAALVIGFIVLLTGSLIVVNVNSFGFAPNLTLPLLMVLFGFWILNQRTSGRAALTAPGGPAPLPAASNAAYGPPPPIGPQPAPARPVVPAFGGPPPGTPSHLPLAPPDGLLRDEPGWQPPPVPPIPPVRGRGGPRPWAMVDPEPAGQPPPPKGPPVTSATLAALVVAVGFLLVLENLAGVGVTATLVLGVVLAVLGGGLVVSGLVGRALGLIPLSLFALLLMPVAPLIDNTLSGGIGDRRVRVTSNDVLEESYTLGMGSMKLDLSGVTVADGETVEVGVDVGAGYAEIVVPADVRVEVRATSLFGYVEVFNAHDQGVDNEIRQIRRPQTVTSAGETSAGDPPGNGDGDAGADAGAGAASDTSNEGSLVIVADVTFGYVEVDDRG